MWQIKAYRLNIWRVGGPRRDKGVNEWVFVGSRDRLITVCVIVSGSNQAVDECTVTMGFHQWLSSVTERIHQTMHYQFDGKDACCFQLEDKFYGSEVWDDK